MKLLFLAISACACVAINAKGKVILTITVSNTNDAPVIDVNNFPEVEFNEDDTYSFNISGYDVDFDLIDFTINQVQPFEDGEIDSIGTFIESNVEDTILTFTPIEHYNGSIEFKLKLKTPSQNLGSFDSNK